MVDKTASRAAGVRLKKMRGSRLRCVMNRTDGQTDGRKDGRTDGPFFFFGPVKPLENLGFSWRNCKALSLSARASLLRFVWFVLAIKV